MVDCPRQVMQRYLGWNSRAKVQGIRNWYKPDLPALLRPGGGGKHEFMGQPPGTEMTCFSILPACFRLLVASMQNNT